MPDIYRFGKSHTDGDASMRELLGGKGANLTEMCRIGMPVPPGFILPTTLCAITAEPGFKKRLEGAIDEGLRFIEAETKKKFADKQDPLLIAVRSGARVSMPGMMDTVLNLGIDLEIADAWSQRVGRLAFDAYRRNLHMIGDVVLGICADDDDPFERALTELKRQRGVATDTKLSTEDLRALALRYEAIIVERRSDRWPLPPYEALVDSAAAVFSSWNAPRARSYRRLHRIPEHWGTACNVQAMVFGDRNEESGSGVCFTRDPATGEPVVYGEYLRNAQGEDVVAGTRTPYPIDDLRSEAPALHRELLDACRTLEIHFRDLQDIEFTIDDGKLYILQTRRGKRSAIAAVKIACDLVREGRIRTDEALMRVEPAEVEKLLLPALAEEDAERAVRDGRALLAGLAASPGAGVGRIAFSSKRAVEWAQQGPVLLVRAETSADDIEGMHASSGIVTRTGGSTSHAAVVARGMGRPAVVGCDDFALRPKDGTLQVGERLFREGDVWTIDGTRGRVFEGELPLRPSGLAGDLERLLEWADEVAVLAVRANADTPGDARQARRFGALGIGLCRTEHMFFKAERIVAMREMILAEDRPAREKALAKLLPMQREDFRGLFEAMAGLPVTIRLLDPPLHEFLPHGEQAEIELARELGVEPRVVHDSVERTREQNPMLGHRGCRLAISYPEIARMQARAIAEAYLDASAAGHGVLLEVMVPLVATHAELDVLAELVRAEMEDVAKSRGEGRIPCHIGSMIELPRAALQAGALAEVASFFSFGTNDLTQTTFGLSRDDAAGFISDYLAQGVLEHDPFRQLDEEGVGELIRLAIKRGRSTRPDLVCGLCGEHGGDKASIAIFHKMGGDYVSCSPFRVPGARLAVAQAALGLPESQRRSTRAPKSVSRS